MPDIEITKKMCLKSCDGMHVDVRKHPVEIVHLPEYEILLDEYLNYTWFENYKSRYIQLESLQHNTTLKFVRIFFGTTRFNIITKDISLKFTDMLSAIGVTMGLFTGFSIISGVEIVYHATKFIISFVIKKKN